MSINLFEHNRIAYEAAVSMLNETGKAAVIHPTGTGKSFIGFKLCEDNPDARICWLSPSAYIFKTQIENLKRAANGYVPENIEFYTYARMMRMDKDERAGICPDYIILDEFHRCGAEMWGQGVQSLLQLFPKTPILGLSATAIRYLDNQRNMAGELFDNHIASEMTLGEAIVRGILQQPVYIISMYSWQQELEKYVQKVHAAKNNKIREKAEHYLEALRRALEKAEGIDVIFRKYMKEKTGKYIIFCADYEHMLAMLEHVQEWFGGIDKTPHIYKAYSDDPDTEKAFACFKADNSQHLKLLFCIDMLNEGIHVDDVSGVILLRPTASPIIYKQQIGRALSASMTGTPIIFDIVNNFESLSSISTIQEEMQIAVNYYRRREDSIIIVAEQFQIFGEAKECLRLFRHLEETLTVSWDKMYAMAKDYYLKYGNLSVTNNYKTGDGYSLGAWLTTQRNIRKGTAAGNLTDDQIKRLDAIGMRWENYNDIMWNKNYAALKKYYEQYGNIDIPSNYVTEEGIALGRWIVNLRTCRSGSVRKNIVTPERIQQLDDLGMIWNKVNYLWEKNYQAALEYFMIHQNLRVPKDYRTEDGLPLGRWIYNICLTYRKSGGKSLTAQQKERLEDIGLKLSDQTAAEQEWRANYEKAKQYYIIHGNLEVPYGYKTADGFSLGLWIRRHRKGSKQKSDIIVTEERRRLLNEIGMVWETEKNEDSWQKYYRLAEKYYGEYGHLKLTARSKYEGVCLGSWLRRQREAYRAGKLSDIQVQSLNALHFDWNITKKRREILDLVNV